MLHNIRAGMIGQIHSEVVQESNMPPAAKGGNPLWKPHLGMRLSRERVSFPLLRSLVGMNNRKAL